MFRILKNQFFWLSLIVVLGFWVRLYRLDSPIADWHSWRQADTAAVTRNFIKMGFNPLIPFSDDMSRVSDFPTQNLNRFRFVEFPIYNIAVYPFYLLFGINETYHRLVSVLFSLGSIILVFLISKRYLGTFTSLLSAFVYALLPFNIFFSRTTLPEPTFVFFCLGMIYFVDKWIWEGKRVWGMWGFIFTTIAFLIKPWTFFLLIPLVYSIIKKGKRIPLKYGLFLLLALTPFIVWRLWILQQPEGIPASGWLFNEGGIRFRPAFWWWIISERMGREILGVTGLFLFFLGLIIRPKDNNYFLHFWALSIFLYFIVFAAGNIRHDYYQIIFVPIASIFAAIGFTDLMKGKEGFVPRVWTIILALLFLPLSFYFSFMQVKGLYQINNPAIIEAGKAADQILPQNAVVVAPYNGDTAFLYQINRPGFPLIAFSLKELIADYGVRYYVSTTKDNKTKWVMRHFQIMEDKPNYMIADLTRLKEPFNNLLDKEP